MSDKSSNNDMKKNVNAYSSIFIYPFAFKKNYWTDMIKTTLNNECWNLDLYNTEAEFKMDRLQYFFPYVHNFLYPTARWNKDLKEEYENSKNNIFIQKKIEKSLKESTCARFRYIFKNSEEQFELGTEEETISCKFYRISMLLFPSGVGFLIFDVVIDKSEVSFDELIYTNDLFRGLNKFHKKRELAFIKYEIESNVTKLSVRDFINEKLNIPEEAKPSPDYIIFVDKLISYCYVALESGELVVKDDDSFFNKFKAMSLEDSPIKINRSEKDIEEWELCRWANTRMSFSPNDGGVVFSYVLPREKMVGVKSAMSTRRDVRNYYLDMLLLSLLIRLSLLHISWKLSQTKNLVNGYSQIEELRLSILNFTNKCWFSQITVAPYGQEIWDRWKGVMKLDKLYMEVKTQLGELDDYISRKKQDNLSKWGGVLAAIAIPFTLVFSYYGQNFNNFNEIGLGDAINNAGFIVIISIIIIIFVFTFERIRFKCTKLKLIIESTFYNVGSKILYIFSRRHNKSINKVNNEEVM